MSTNYSVEVTAGTVEDAIDKGLKQLGVGPSQVIVEVLEEPSKGLFGLGSRQAKVRLQLLAPPPAKAESSDAETSPEPPKATPQNPAAAVASEPAAEAEDGNYEDDFFDEDGSYGEDEEREQAPKPEIVDEEQPQAVDDDQPIEEPSQRRRGRGSRDRQPSSDKASQDQKSGNRSRRKGRDRRRVEGQISDVEVPPIVFEDDAKDIEIGEIVLDEMLAIMGVDATVTAIPAEPVEPDNETDDEEDDRQAPSVLNIDGDEVNELIGRRGETVAALQYLTRLIISKQTESRANVVVDVANYRSRRSSTLEKLAVRMADQAVETNRVVTMEPMPPHERRIIHMVLRKRDDVKTESKGQGDSRRVTIVPKDSMIS